MYKIIKIGGKDYKFEYTIEASLYQDFVKRLTEFTMSFGGLMAKYDITGKNIKTENDLIDTSVEAMTDIMVKSTTQIPKLAIEGFYAGLIEHEKLSNQEAFDLYKQYLQEYRKKPSDVLREIMDKVQEDNFFDLIGLDLKKIAKTSPKAKEKKPTKKQ